MDAPLPNLVWTEAERPLGERLLKLATETDRLEGYKEPHAVWLTQLAVALGERLGLYGMDLSALKFAALAHDLGERALRSDYLTRPERLTWEEQLDLWRHPILGEQEAAALKLPRQAQLLIRWHHETWQGTGYPDGLTGAAIPLGARILRAVDTYVALCSERPHRPRYDETIAEQILSETAGLSCDPHVIRELLEILSALRAARDAALAEQQDAFDVALPGADQPDRPDYQLTGDQLGGAAAAAEAAVTASANFFSSDDSAAGAALSTTEPAEPEAQRSITESLHGPASALSVTDEWGSGAFLTVNINNNDINNNDAAQMATPYETQPPAFASSSATDEPTNTDTRPAPVLDDSPDAEPFAPGLVSAWDVAHHAGFAQTTWPSSPPTTPQNVALSAERDSLTGDLLSLPSLPPEILQESARAARSVRPYYEKDRTTAPLEEPAASISQPLGEPLGESLGESGGAPHHEPFDDVRNDALNNAPNNTPGETPHDAPKHLTTDRPIAPTPLASISGEHAADAPTAHPTDNETTERSADELR